MNDLLLRHLATDKRSLAVYLYGGRPSVEDIRSNLFLAERAVNFTRPDHFYQNVAIKHFDGCASVSDLICRTFDALTDNKVTWRAEKLHIHLEHFEEWHNLITRFPPLPLVAYAIFRKHGAPDGLVSEFIPFIERDILPNLGATALIGPHHAVLDELTREPGLYDLHQHLNGTTEADIVWLNTLERPYEFYENFRGAFNSREVREQIGEFDYRLTPEKVHDNIRLAALLRYRLIEHMLGDENITVSSLHSMANLVNMPFSRIDTQIPFRGHPLRRYISDYCTFEPMVLEGLFHILIFRHLRRNSSSAFAHAYHLYLLLLGTFCELVVQQHEQFGFDQFQRITINEFRADAERDYQRRFRQIGGNNGQGVVFVEGRFAPKGDKCETRNLFRTIMTGYARHCNDFTYDYDLHIPLDNMPRLRLVAHFIKRPDNGGSRTLLVRHHVLRVNLERQARAILAVRQEDETVRKYLVGIDAAANELHASPEVFAPVYRRFRRTGFVNFTFHVGEDFVHLLSGLRRVWEAVNFLDLRSGNRIGHATALGIDPRYWINAIGGKVTISHLEWLDNLIFTYELVKNVPEGQPYLERLRVEIESSASSIYRCDSQLSWLIDAWKMRGLDPLIACYSGRSRTDCLIWHDMEEWNKIESAQQENLNAFKIFCRYQMLDSGIDLKMVSVDSILVDVPLMELLQRLLLEQLHYKGIIIETMPTSNVRISFYRNYRDHHIWRWLKNDSSQKPPLCIASDDPGIFATNLYNEYAHIFQGLISHEGKTLDEATEIMNSLANNARRYRFENT